MENGSDHEHGDDYSKQQQQENNEAEQVQVQKQPPVTRRHSYASATKQVDQQEQQATSSSSGDQKQQQRRRHSDFSVVANISSHDDANHRDLSHKNARSLFHNQLSSSLRSSFSKIGKNRRTSFASSSGENSMSAMGFVNSVSTWIKRRRSSMFSNTNSTASDSNTPFQNYWANIARYNGQQPGSSLSSSNMHNNRDDHDDNDQNHNNLMESGVANINNHDNTPRNNNERYPHRKLWKRSQTSIKMLSKSFLRLLGVALQHKSIWFPVLITFAVLCSSGLGIVLLFANDEQDQLLREATDLALEMGFQIPSVINQALLPLFTLDNLVQNTDTFYDLPFKTNAAPTYVDIGRPWRNTTGICDDPAYVERYDEIAQYVKESANLQKILINVQLAPSGVFCLGYPLINSEDFDDGAVMDNRGAIGLDLLRDPVSGFYAKQAIKDDRVTIQGPITLLQAASNFSVQALIARNPIFVEGHSLEIEGRDYPFWGYSTVLLNWEVLRQSLGIDDFFQSRGVEYSMTKTDTLIDFASNQEYKRVAVIAESEGAEKLAHRRNVTVPLRTTDNEWQLTVGARPENRKKWILGCVGVVIGSFLISLSLMVVLVLKKEDELLLFRMMPRQVIQRLQKNETVIEKYDLATVAILDIVSFTRLSGQMKPIEVMQMLKILFTVFDQLAEKHQVQNVETIGDAYIVIGAGPERCSGREGAEKTALFALDAIEALRKLELENSLKLSIRAGLASGMVIAGVVGKIPPKYTLFGETVTLASKIESTSSAMRVQCSVVTSLLLRDSKNHNFELEERRDYHPSTNEYSPTTWWINSKEPRTQRGFFSENLWNFTGHESEVLGAEKSTHSSVSSESSGLLPDYINDDDDEDYETYDFRDSEPEGTAVVVKSDARLSSLGISVSSKGITGVDSDSSGLIQDGSDSSGLIPDDTDDEEESTESFAPSECGKFPYEEKEERNYSRNPLLKTSSSANVENVQVRIIQGTTNQDEEQNKKTTSHSNWEDVAPASFGNYHSNNSSQYMSLEAGGSNLEDSISKLEVQSNRTKESDAFENYWSRLAKNKNAWDATPDDRSEALVATIRCWDCMKAVTTSTWHSIKHAYYTAFTHRSILYSAIVMFICFAAAGLTAVLLLANDREESRRNTALSLGDDASRMLLNTGTEAFLPLFVMAQMVRLLDIFDILPQELSKANIFEKDNFSAFRDVTSTCNDPSYLGPFTDIALAVMEMSDLKGVVVNLQLAPAGVVCLLYPQVNYEDFSGGLHLDSRSAIGHDLINDKTSTGFYIREAAKTGRSAVQGPLTLLQDDKKVLEEALIIRIPVYKNSYNTSVDDEQLEFWGFATSILNWAQLKEITGFKAFFDSHGAEFFMTKADTLVNLTTREEYQEIRVIGYSDGWESLNDDNSITRPIRSFSDWDITVGFKDGFTPEWKYWGSICVVFGSLLATHVLVMVLVAKTDHEILLYRMMPRDVIRRLQMGETVVETSTNATIFFSHIIGFKTMSGQMDPRNFMVMLNQIYGEFDKLVIRHRVNKVETIGDAYIVTCNGIEKNSGRDASERVALFALDAMAFVKQYRYNDMRVFIRSGLATGPVVFGVVGAAVPKYTIFGDTVNYASRMESTSKSMKIQCSEKTAELLHDSDDYDFSTEMRREGDERGIEVKGKGLVQTWWIRDVRRSDESGMEGNASESSRKGFLRSSHRQNYLPRSASFRASLNASTDERKVSFGASLSGEATPSERIADAV